jgi:hypothetical protein
VIPRELARIVQDESIRRGVLREVDRSERPARRRRRAENEPAEGVVSSEYVAAHVARVAGG